MNETNITISEDQAQAFAALIVPAAIRAYIDANRQEFELWREERQRDKVVSIVE